VDSDLHRRVSSSELTLPGSSGHEGSPGWLQRKEGQARNLTEVFGDRLDGEVRLATKRNKQRWWCSVWGEWRHREAKQKVGRGAVGCCSARCAFYKPRGSGGGGEAADGGGFLIPIGFDIESVRGVDEAPS
jgi:hypothetical protein